MNSGRIPPSVYSHDFYLTCNDGFKEFSEGRRLSYIKKKEISLLDISERMRFLDIGFGRGDILYHCDKLGAYSYGIDYSPDAVSIAGEALKNSSKAKIIQADCLSLPFPDGFFQRILIGDLIEHLPFEKGVVLLNEACRVLSKGGFFILHTSPNVLFMKLVYPFLIRIAGAEKRPAILKHLAIQNSVHVYEYTFFSLRKLAKKISVPCRIWMDEDLTRGGTFRHLGGLSKGQKVLLKISRIFKNPIFSPFRVVFSNDIWMKGVKA